MMKNTKHILIAEDDAFLAEVMRKSLLSRNLHVSVAYDGEKTIEAITVSPPDILLLDLLMPRIDGFAVLEHIRKLGYSFPVIILSNLSDNAHREKCNKLGISGYFVKSDMDDSELLAIVEKYLQDS